MCPLFCADGKEWRRHETKVEAMTTPIDSSPATIAALIVAEWRRDTRATDDRLRELIADAITDRGRVVLERAKTETRLALDRVKA